MGRYPASMRRGPSRMLDSPLLPRALLVFLVGRGLRHLGTRMARCEGWGDGGGRTGGYEAGGRTDGYEVRCMMTPWRCSVGPTLKKIAEATEALARAAGTDTPLADGDLLVGVRKRMDTQ